MGINNDDFFTKLLKKEDKIKKISSNTDYILWLIKFTLNNPEFSDEDFLYFSDKITDEDNDYVNDLGLFFEVIDRYSKKNYLYPVPCDYGGFYRIKFNNNAFEIGCLTGQGIVYFCNKVNINDYEFFIDFDDIMNNKVLEHTEDTARLLDDLKNRIKMLCDMGVAIEAIKSICDNTIYEIEDNINQLILK